MYASLRPADVLAEIGDLALQTDLKTLCQGSEAYQAHLKAVGQQHQPWAVHPRAAAMARRRSCRRQSPAAEGPLAWTVLNGRWLVVMRFMLNATALLPEATTCL